MDSLASHQDAGKAATPAREGVLLKLRRFVEDRRGVGALEFAIVAPLLIMTYIGAFEISVAFTMLRKVNRASSTVSDLLTQSNTTNKATLDTMGDVTKTVIAPFAQDGYSLKITGIAVAANGQAKVAWSRDQKAGRPYLPGSGVTLPSSMSGLASTFIVRTELTVPHTVLLLVPNLAPEFNKINFSKTSYFRQRTGDKVDCPDC